MDKKVLRQLGMTEYESEIFIVLTKNGPLSAYDLAKKTGMYRQATYDSLERMQEKGFISHVLKSGKKIFQAIEPELILEHFEEAKKEYENILPELLAMRNFGKDDISVEVFKGKNIEQIATRDIINTLKKTGGEVLFTSNDENIPITNSKTILEQYERDLIKYNIKERLILKKGTRGQFIKGQSAYRYIDEKYFNPNPSITYADRVVIMIFGNPSHAILIKSKSAADSFKKQFEFMWKFAEKK